MVYHDPVYEQVRSGNDLKAMTMNLAYGMQQNKTQADNNVKTMTANIAYGMHQKRKNGRLFT